MRIRHQYWLIVLLLGMASCYYDVEADFQMMVGCDTSTVTYASTIVPILESRCYKCHSEGLNLGNVTLEGYDNLRLFVDNGRFLGAVKHEVGFSPMPQNEMMLSDCNIAKIEAWIAEGAPNN